MTDENVNEVYKEESKNEEINVIGIMDKIMKQRSACFPIFNKYKNKTRKRKKQKSKLDDTNILEAEIIKEREEELNKALRAF